jgi:hypothetical protein
MNIREILEKKHAITLLIIVHNNPGIVQKPLIGSEGKGRTAKIQRVKDLVKAGLLIEKRASDDWTALNYYVSEEGGKIARAIIKLETGEDPETNYGSSPLKGNKMKG